MKKAYILTGVLLTMSTFTLGEVFTSIVQGSTAMYLLSGGAVASATTAAYCANRDRKGVWESNGALFCTIVASVLGMFMEVTSNPGITLPIYTCTLGMLLLPMRAITKSSEANMRNIAHGCTIVLTAALVANAVVF